MLLLGPRRGGPDNHHDRETKRQSPGRDKSVHGIVGGGNNPATVTESEFHIPTQILILRQSMILLFNQHQENRKARKLSAQDGTSHGYLPPGISAQLTSTLSKRADPPPHPQLPLPPFNGSP